jgi:hypothetical protein
MYRRFAAVAVAVVALVVLSAPAVSAAQAARYHFDYTTDPYTMTGICPFEFTAVSHLTGDETDVLDTSGNVVSAIVVTLEQDTFTGLHDQTLVSEPYRFLQRYRWDADGNLVVGVGTGVIMRVVLPGGTLFLGAGRYDFLAHGFASTITPDSGHSGDVAAFCAALS